MAEAITGLTFKEFGALGDGVRNDTIDIQRSIEAAALVATTSPNKRAVVIGTDGTYRINRAIDVPSNVTVVCLPGCVFLRTADGGGLRVAFGPDAVDAAWIGGTFLCVSDSVLGDVFQVNGAKRITIRDIVIRGWQPTSGAFIPGYQGGKGIAVDGEDIRILNPTIMDPVGLGAAGIRISRGRRIAVLGGTIVSGDDSIALVPGKPGDPGNEDGTASIEDVILSDLILTGPRCLNFGLSTGNPDDGTWGKSSTTPPIYLMSSIRRCRATNIVAFGVNRGLAIRNDLSAGVIDDISISGFTLHCGPSNYDAVAIRNNAGGVRRIALSDVTVLNAPVSTATNADGSPAYTRIVTVEGVDGFTWNRGRIDSPGRDDRPGKVFLPTVRIGGVVNGALSGLSLGCRIQPGLVVDFDAPEGSPNQFGIVPRPSRGVVIDDVVIEQVPANGYGLTIDNAVNCGARGVRFTPALVATGPGTLPSNTTLTDVYAADPLPLGAYTITGQSSALFTVRNADASNAAIGQGRNGQPFSSRGLSFLFGGTGLVADVTVTITVSVVANARGASLGAGATACFLDGCDMGEVTPASAVTVAPGRDHRVADLYPRATANNYVGGLFGQANSWSRPQTLTQLALLQGNASIAGGAITVTASQIRLTGEDSAADELTTITGGANGTVLVLRNALATAPITVTSGGNIRLLGNRTLKSLYDTLTLIQGTGANWSEVAEVVRP